MHVEHGKFRKYRLWTNGDSWRIFNVVIIHVWSSVWLSLLPVYFVLALICLLLPALYSAIVLMWGLTFIQLYSLSPHLYTPSFIGTWSRLDAYGHPWLSSNFQIHWTCSHTVRASLFMLTPISLVSTCPMDLPWFNMTMCVTVAYTAPLRSASHCRPNPLSHVNSAGQ